MDDLFSPGAGQGSSEQLTLATVGSVTAAGVTLIFDGSSAATQKRYKRLVTGQTLAVGDRVLVARISGSYVVLGKIAY